MATGSSTRLAPGQTSQPAIVSGPRLDGNFRLVPLGVSFELTGFYVHGDAASMCPMVL